MTEPPAIIRRNATAAPQSTWISVLSPTTTQKLKKPRKQPSERLLQRATLVENQATLREYLRKNPGAKQKKITSDLDWGHAKLEYTIKSMRSEFYSGLVLKSMVNHG